MGATAAWVFIAPARRTASAATLRSLDSTSFTSSFVFALASRSAACCSSGRTLSFSSRGSQAKTVPSARGFNCSKSAVSSPCDGRSADSSSP